MGILEFSYCCVVSFPLRGLGGTVIWSPPPPGVGGDRRPSGGGGMDMGGAGYRVAVALNVGSALVCLPVSSDQPAHVPDGVLWVLSRGHVIHGEVLLRTRLLDSRGWSWHERGAPGACFVGMPNPS